jgi:hypothetical protein
MDRHCERSEAIQKLSAGAILDCFIAIAPRNDGLLHHRLQISYTFRVDVIHRLREACA